MSSSKKRSICKKIIIDEKIEKDEFHTSPSSTSDSTVKCVQDIYFGERVNHPYFRSDEEIYLSYNSSSALTDILRDKGIEYITWSKSSSACTSDSDYLEAELSKNIKERYNKVEDIFYEESYSPSGEYDQWKNNFVYLRVTGTASKLYPSNGKVTNGKQEEETIAECYDKSVQFVNAKTKEPSIKSKIKEAVISSILKDVRGRLRQKHREYYSSTPVASKQKKAVRVNQNTTLKRIDPNITRSYNETYLQVSSIPLHNSPLNCTGRHNYQSPIMRSHMSASKWQREHTEYASLPHVAQPQVPSAAHPCKRVAGPAPCTCTCTCTHNTYSATAKKHVPPTACKKVPVPDARNVTLPPIHNLKLYVSGDGCKSVSPTPAKFTHTCKKC